MMALEIKQMRTLFRMHIVLLIAIVSSAYNGHWHMKQNATRQARSKTLWDVLEKDIIDTAIVLVRIL